MGIATERARLVDLLREQRMSGRHAARSSPTNCWAGLAAARPAGLHGPRGAASAARRRRGAGGARRQRRCADLPSGGRLAQRSGRAGRDHPRQRVQHPGPDHALASASWPKASKRMSSPCTSEWLRGSLGYTVVPLLIEGQAIGTLMLNTRQPRLLSEDELRFLRLMANQATIAVDGLRLRQEEVQRQRLQKALWNSGIRLGMLPKACPIIPHWQVVAVYQPTRMVGGDFYDLPGASRRAGHAGGRRGRQGCAAAVHGPQPHGDPHRAQRPRGPRPRCAAARRPVDPQRQPKRPSARSMPSGAETGRLLYANAGHNRPLWYRAATGTLPELHRARHHPGCFRGYRHRGTAHRGRAGRRAALLHRRHPWSWTARSA